MEGHDIVEYDMVDQGDTVIVDTKGRLSSGKTITVTAEDGSNVYINSAASSTYTTTSSDPVRVIVQSGEKAPYIVVIK